MPVSLLPLAMLSGPTVLAVLVIGLLIFGRRLPEVGKNLGKTIVEFKKGLSGGYSGEKDVLDEEPEGPEEPRRLTQGRDRGRVVAGKPARKRLPENEEV